MGKGESGCDNKRSGLWGCKLLALSDVSLWIFVLDSYSPLLLGFVGPVPMGAEKYGGGPKSSYWG